MTHKHKKTKSKIIKFKTARGIKYKLVWRAPAKSYNAAGLCDDPKSKKPEILIDPKLLDKRLLSVLIEELSHAFWFEKPEKEVRKFAAVLTRLIYQLGWRKTKK